MTWPTTTVPGVSALHALITPTCRQNRGDAGAFDEAVRRLREEYDAVVAGWRKSGKPDGIHVHLVLTVERIR